MSITVPSGEVESLLLTPPTVNSTVTGGGYSCTNTVMYSILLLVPFPASVALASMKTGRSSSISRGDGSACKVISVIMSDEALTVSSKVRERISAVKSSEKLARRGEVESSVNEVTILAAVAIMGSIGRLTPSDIISRTKRDEK